MALEAVKTNEFVVEKIDTKIRALIKEGRNGICSRFIAISSVLFCQLSRRKWRTNDVRRFGCSGGTICDSPKEVWVIRSRYYSDAEGSGEVEEYDSVNDRVKGGR